MNRRPDSARMASWIRFGPALVLLGVSGLVLVLWLVMRSSSAGSLPGSAGESIEVLFEPTARIGEVNRTLQLARVDEQDVAELQVNSLLVDDAGVVWLTVSEPVVEALPTDTQLVSFDGERWQRLEPPFPVYRALAGNREYLWVDAFGALARFDGESWDRYTSEDGAARSYVSSAALDPSGQVWIYSIGLMVGDSPDGEMTQIPPALSSFDGTSWSRREPNQYEPFDAGSIAIGTDGSLVVSSSTARWGSGEPGGIWELRAEAIRQLWAPPPLRSDLNSLAVASDGAVWSTFGESVVRVAGDEATVYEPADGIGNKLGSAAVIEWATSSIDAADGAVWVATLGGGISRFDGESWTTFDETDGLPSLEVTDLAVARNGRLWIRYPQDGQRVGVYQP